MKTPALVGSSPSTDGKTGSQKTRISVAELPQSSLCGRNPEDKSLFKYFDKQFVWVYIYMHVFSFF